MLLVRFIRGIKLRRGVYDDIPDVRSQLDDVMMTTITMFVKLINTIHNSTIEDWDHSALKSRVALAFCASTASKYILDVHAFGAVAALQCFTTPDETMHVDAYSLLTYIQEYELAICNDINIFACYFNHATFSHEFIDVLKSKGVINVTNATHVADVIPFLCLALSSFIRVYVQTHSTRVIGQSIVVLALECMRVSGSAVVRSAQLLNGLQTFAFAARMACDLAKQHTAHSEALLNELLPKGSWIHSCMTRRNFNTVYFRLNLTSQHLIRGCCQWQEQSPFI